MRHHQNGAAFFGSEVLENIKHRRSIARVQIAGGFIGQDDGGVIGQRSRNGRALAHAAGKLFRQLRSGFRHAKRFQQFHRLRARCRILQTAKAAHWDQHIIQRGEFRQQEMELEHKAQALEAQIGEFCRTQACGIAAFQQHASFGWPIQQAKQIEQG